MVSLLPAGFVTAYGTALNISRIIVLNPVHEQAFAHVARRLPGVTVQRLMGGAIGAALSLLALLLAAKLRRRRVVFFHECCWPLFDILVGVVKPRGRFFPQVTMSSFEQVSLADLPKPSGWKAWVQRQVLRAVGNQFVVYRTARDSADHGYNYSFSYRQYPDTIEIAPVGARPAGTERAEADRGEPTSSRALTVLLITGTEPVPDDDLRATYLALIDVAIAEGYAVHIKDHPLAKLGVPSAACIHVDPTLPIELITERFAFAIGVASTGLMGAGDRKLSILDMLNSMPDEARRMRREHLLALPGGDRVEFVADLASVRTALRQHRQAMADLAASR